MMIYKDMCRVDALLSSPIGGRGGRYCPVLRTFWHRPTEGARQHECAMLDYLSERMVVCHRKKPCVRGHERLCILPVILHRR